MHLFDDLRRPPVFDMSELEHLFSAVLPSSDGKRSDKSGSRASGSKPEKIHLVSFSKRYSIYCCSAILLLIC